MAEQNTRVELGARLRSMRNEAGYTLADFGGRIGLDASRLSRMERGERGIDTLVLRRAADVLSVSLDAFFPVQQEPLVMARANGVDADCMAEMVKWAQDLRSDLDLVSEFSDERS